MNYEREFAFLQAAMRNCHLQLLRLDHDAVPSPAVDFGLRQMLGLSHFYTERTLPLLRSLRERALYRVRDEFSCRYLFFLLPEGSAQRGILIGPYLDADLTHEQLLEEAERHALPPRMFRLIENYYGSLPVFTNEAPVFAIVQAFCELLWGDDFEVHDIQDEGARSIHTWENSAVLEQAGEDAEAIEARYRFENEILRAVEQGQSHRLELMMSSFSSLAFERRLPDELRNLKNYCIILNTLLRKAAQSGGVHPLYLDRISSDFARRIEQLPTPVAVRPLMEEMYREYCRLVRTQRTEHYSLPVQKALLYIDTHLAGDLSLKTLAAEQGVSASYLSSLFHKQLGQTLSDYVAEKRLRYAQRLLRTTKLQVQTVAQYCGIYDVGYFSKQFKRMFGQSPRQYRETNISAEQ